MTDNLHPASPAPVPTSRAEATSKITLRVRRQEFRRVPWSAREAGRAWQVSVANAWCEVSEDFAQVLDALAAASPAPSAGTREADRILARIAALPAHEPFVDVDSYGVTRPSMERDDNGSWLDRDDVLAALCASSPSDPTDEAATEGSALKDAIGELDAIIAMQRQSVTARRQLSEMETLPAVKASPARNGRPAMRAMPADPEHGTRHRSILAIEERRLAALITIRNAVARSPREAQEQKP